MRFDLDLLEQLNDEYRDKPIHNLARLAERRRMLTPTSEDRPAATREERVRHAASAQLNPILVDIDVAGKSVLEVGCGHGYLSAAVAETAGARESIGVDIERSESWDEHDDPRLRLLIGDLAADALMPAESIDVVISQVVFEHVTRPIQMLAAVFDLLRPRGTAWLRMNVYTARNASHLYREIFFPWPHLLFEDHVVEQFCARYLDGTRKGFVWINRMTVAHYLRAVEEIGFEIVAVRRKVTPIDLPFYLRFEAILGRYQALDLETDFLTLILEKPQGLPAHRTSTEPGYSYVERQRALDEAIRLVQAESGRAYAGPG